MFGEWGSDRTRETALAGRMRSAQTRAKAMKKTCSSVKSRPGRRSSVLGVDEDERDVFHASYACERPASPMSSLGVSFEGPCQTSAAAYSRRWSAVSKSASSSGIEVCTHIAIHIHLLAIRVKDIVLAVLLCKALGTFFKCLDSGIRPPVPKPTCTDISGRDTARFDLPLSSY